MNLTKKTKKKKKKKKKRNIKYNDELTHRVLPRPSVAEEPWPIIVTPNWRVQKCGGKSVNMAARGGPPPAAVVVNITAVCRRSPSALQATTKPSHMEITHTMV